MDDEKVTQWWQEDEDWDPDLDELMVLIYKAKAKIDAANWVNLDWEKIERLTDDLHYFIECYIQKKRDLDEEAEAERKRMMEIKP